LRAGQIVRAGVMDVNRTTSKHCYVTRMTYTIIGIAVGFVAFPILMSVYFPYMPEWIKGMIDGIINN
jgi:hypothetical protein